MITEEFYKKALQCLNKEQFEEAISYCDQALKDHGADPRVRSTFYDLKGLTLMRRSDHDLRTALAFLNTAIEEAPTNYFAWAHKGEVMGREAKYTEALYCLERAIALTERRIDTDEDARTIYLTSLNDKAWILVDGFQEFDGAIECCKKALGVDPYYEDAKINKRIAEEKKKIGQATAVGGIKRCPHCGAIVYPWSVYCPMCGKKMSKASLL